LRAWELARTSGEDQLSRALREAADARAENRSLQSQIDQMRAENDRLNRDLSDARARLNDLQSQYSTTAVKLNEERTRADAMAKAERDRREAEARRQDFASLSGVLASICTGKAKGDGVGAGLPGGVVSANRTALALSAKAKMDALARAIAAHSDVRFTIEGNCDARAAADSFAMGRAQSVADYIIAVGVSAASFKVVSQGDSVPVSSNKTLRGRAANRRVELVFVGPR